MKNDLVQYDLVCEVIAQIFNDGRQIMDIEMNVLHPELPKTCMN